MRQRVTDENPDMKVLDVMKEVGRRWQNISPQEKAVYEAKSSTDKERFKQENAVYQRDLMNMQQILNTKIEQGEIDAPQIDLQMEKVAKPPPAASIK